MLLQIKAGTTSKILQLPIFDSSSTTGGMLEDLVYNTSGLSGYYSREGVDGTAIEISLASATKGTWTSGGFVEIDGSNMPGWYELHIPDATIAAGAKAVAIQLRGAANMVPVNILLELTAVDNQDSVRFGLTALPNVASGNAGAVITSGTGTAQLSVSSGSVTVGTNNDKTGYTASTVSDKTGYSLSVTPPTAAEIRVELDSSSTQLAAILEDTGTTIPNQISGLNDVDATSVAESVWQHESRTLTSAGEGGATAQEVWEYATRVLTASTNIDIPTAEEIRIEIDSSSTQLAAILEDTGTTIPNQITALNDVDATSVAASVWEHESRTLTSAGASGATAQEVWEYGSRSLTDKSGFSLSVTPPTAGTIADAVWDEARAGHTSSGTFGQGIASVQGNVTGAVATVANPVTITQTVAANVIQIQNQDLSGTDTRLADNFSSFFDVETPLFTLNDIRDLTDTEVQQIRYRLGLDGVSDEPSASPTLPVTIVDGSITSATFDSSTAFPITEDSSLANIADAVLDEEIETGWTLRELIRILSAYAAGRTSGSGTTSIIIRDILNTKNRIIASLDEDGNRVGVTLVGD